MCLGIIQDAYTLFLGTHAATASYFIIRVSGQSNVCGVAALKECASMFSTHLQPLYNNNLNRSARSLAIKGRVLLQRLTPAVHCTQTSAHKLSIGACVHASLDGEPAPYGVPTVRCKRTLSSHGTC